MSYLAPANTLENRMALARLVLVWVIERHLALLCSQQPARLVPDNTLRCRVLTRKLKVEQWVLDLKLLEIKETQLVLDNTKRLGLF
jgi:hypothetical protein